MLERRPEEALALADEVLTTTEESESGATLRACPFDAASAVRNPRLGDTHHLMERTSRSDGIAGDLACCPVVEVAAGEPYFEASFREAVLLAVERGFVVMRSTPAGLGRSIVTCDVGAGEILLPPAPDEALFGLVESRLIAITADARDRLLQAPGAADTLFEQLTQTLARKHEALGNFAHTRHIERVRRKLLQLAQSYGHVAADGIRIDFPVSHTLLADMIGSSRETVTRSLDELQRTGFVVRCGHTYRLLVAPERVLEPM